MKKLSDQMRKRNAGLNNAHEYADEVADLEKELQELKNDIAKIHKFQHENPQKRVSAVWWGENVVDWIIDYAHKLETTLIMIR